MPTNKRKRALLVLARGTPTSNYTTKEEMLGQAVHSRARCAKGVRNLFIKRPTSANSLNVTEGTRRIWTFDIRVCRPYCLLVCYGRQRQRATKMLQCDWLVFTTKVLLYWHRYTSVTKFQSGSKFRFGLCVLRIPAQVQYINCQIVHVHYMRVTREFSPQMRD